jgi:hypothetical protein
MDGDGVSLDVLQDAIVGGRRAADVVFGLETIDRHDDLETLQRSPFDRHRAHGARHDLCVDPPRRHPWQDFTELAIADEWLAADDRDVNRAVFIDEGEEAPDELLTLEAADCRR